MSSIGPFQSGVQGINTGMNNLRIDAHELAIANKDSTETKDIVKPLVNLSVDRTQVAVSAKVIETADEVIGSLLDVMA